MHRLSPIFLHIDSGLEIRWVCFVISGLGELQQWLGMSVLPILAFLVCLGPSGLGLHWFGSVDRGFSPLLLFACLCWCVISGCYCFVSLFVSRLLLCVCFRRPRRRDLSPSSHVSFSLLSLSVLVGLSSLPSACASSASFCCPPCCLFWRLRGSLPSLLCCALLRCVFLLVVGCVGGPVCFFAFCLNV